MTQIAPRPRLWLNTSSMQPDQNQYPIDYLNQIAPQQQKPGLSTKMMLLIAGGVGLLLIIAGFMIFSSSSAGPTQKMQTLAARMATLQDIASKSQKNIQSGVLRSTNSNLAIFLTNANRDIADPLSKNGVDVKKIDKNIQTAESGDELRTTLEDARLNAVYDRTYAREMAYQLETVHALMSEIYNKTNSKSLKEFLNATNANLQPIIDQLAEFNAANG